MRCGAFSSHRPRGTLMWVCALALASIAAAQPAGEEPPPITLDRLFDNARRAYRESVTADSVVVSVTPPDGQVRSDRFIVRIDCDGIGAEADPRRVLLELGPLRVFVADGRLLGTHAGDPTTYLERALTGPISPASLAEHLPPVPAPQLALAAAVADPMEVPTPYTKGVTWTSAERDLDARAAICRAAGRGFDGPVFLTTDAQTHRLLKFEAQFPGPEGVTKLELACRAIDPGDPSLWAPNLDGRRRVDSLAQLRSLGPAPELKPGETVPDMKLLAPDLTSWSLHGALRAPPPDAGAVVPQAEGPGPGPPHAVVLLFRVPPDAARAAAVEADARAGLGAVRALRDQPLGGPPIVFTDRAAAVIELGDFEREAFLALRERWGSGAGDRGMASDDLLWASSSAGTIDRFSRDAGAVIVVVKPDRTLGAVIRLDGRAAEPAGITSELRAVLDTRPPG